MCNYTRVTKQDAEKVVEKMLKAVKKADGRVAFSAENENKLHKVAKATEASEISESVIDATRKAVQYWDSYCNFSKSELSELYTHILCRMMTIHCCALSNVGTLKSFIGNVCGSGKVTETRWSHKRLSTIITEGGTFIEKSVNL